MGRRLCAGSYGRGDHGSSAHDERDLESPRFTTYRDCGDKALNEELILRPVCGVRHASELGEVRWDGLEKAKWESRICRGKRKTQYRLRDC